ncbi:MAG: RNA methyltransferase [Gemmatimonas sp.]|uniref:RNA methyltransferase n=1 Tax=Gemmatimonas sp. TaxID=1962908 RepID=UPI00391F2460
MAESILDNIAVVLYESQDSINIGGVVRSMKNMGVSDLRLIRPCAYDPNRIEQVAHDTRDIVERIRHFDTIDGALDDCVYVVGFSGRRQAARWARHTPRSAAVDLLEHAQVGKVAIMLGREDHGLPNEALDRAHAICTIPTTEHFSLTVAQACLLGLYEVHLLAGDATKKLPAPRHAAGAPDKSQLERTFADMEAALNAIAYFKTRNEELIMRAFRSLVFRASPEARELLMLRTASIEVLRTIEREVRLSVTAALVAQGVPNAEALEAGRAAGAAAIAARGAAALAAAPADA